MLNAATKAADASASTARMSIADVLIKTAVCMAVVIAAAVPGWIFLNGSFLLYLGVLVAVIVVGVVMARKAPVSAPLALAYSALLGLMVGGFSHSAVTYGTATSGAGEYLALIPQAVAGTIAGAVAMLAVYATPFGRRAAKATRLFVGVIIGYALLGVMSFLAAWLFGVGDGWGLYGLSGIGLLLCALGVVLACWSLLIDIGQVSDALAGGAPANYDWTFGVSLAASLVWLYMEVLRLLAIANR